jgi:hypothetical protein
VVYCLARSAVLTRKSIVWPLGLPGCENQDLQTSIQKRGPPDVPSVGVGPSIKSTIGPTPADSDDEARSIKDSDDEASRSHAWPASLPFSTAGTAGRVGQQSGQGPRLGPEGWDAAADSRLSWSSANPANLAFEDSFARRLAKELYSGAEPWT